MKILTTLIIFTIVFASDQRFAEGSTCICAAMSSTDDNAIPEMEYTFDVHQEYDIPCTIYGLNYCKELCNNLASLTNDAKYGRRQFCRIIKRDINFLPSVFIKFCNITYTYTGKTLEKPVCCKNGANIRCPISNEIMLAPTL